MATADGVANSALADLLATTLEDLPWDGKFEVLQKYNMYDVVNLAFAKDKVVLDSGTSYTRNVSVKESGAAQQVRLYQETEPSQDDVQVQLNVPWTQHQTFWNIERREMLRNRKPAKLISLIKSRRIDAMMDSANLLEALGWKSPDNSSDDLNPYGYPYYLPAITTAQVSGSTHGFQGRTSKFGDGTTSATTAGISASTYDRWRSYNDVWSTTDGSIADADVSTITEALRRLKFQSPVTVRDVTSAPFNNFRLYAGNTLLNSLEQKARHNNDQLGADIGRYAGAVMIKRIPVTYVDYLDVYDSATNYTRQ